MLGGKEGGWKFREGGGGGNANVTNAIPKVILHTKFYPNQTMRRYSNLGGKIRGRGAELREGGGKRNLKKKANVTNRIPK